MANTVIGFFDDAEDARRAVAELQENGISEANIDLAQGRSDSSGTTSASDNDSNDGGNVISRFFNSLFGNDSDDAKRYSNAAANSNYIVTVHADSADEAEEAADILDDCGALDVDERANYGSGNQYNLSDETQRADVSTTSDRLEGGSFDDASEMQTGRGRFRSRIVENSLEERVRLRQNSDQSSRGSSDRYTGDDDMLNAGGRGGL